MWCGKQLEQLGHSPAQQGVFWVYQCYLKRRFEKLFLPFKGRSEQSGREGGTSM